MADKIFRPRRGKKATMVSNATVLNSGEMFFEVPTGGVGTGACNVKMGDGSTSYSSLPYALGADAAVAFTEDTSSTDSALLAKIVSGNSYATLFGAIKGLLSSLVDQVTTLNNDGPECSRLDLADYLDSDNWTWYSGTAEVIRYGNLKIMSIAYLRYTSDMTYSEAHYPMNTRIPVGSEFGYTKYSTVTEIISSLKYPIIASINYNSTSGTTLSLVNNSSTASVGTMNFTLLYV